MIEKLFDIKGLIGMVGFVLLMVVLFQLLGSLQETELGQNEIANQTLEQGKESLSILTNGYFLASGIAGSIAFIVVIVALFKKLTP